MKGNIENMNNIFMFHANTETCQLEQANRHKDEKKNSMTLTLILTLTVSLSPPSTPSTPPYTFSDNQGRLQSLYKQTLNLKP